MSFFIRLGTVSIIFWAAFLVPLVLAEEIAPAPDNDLNPQFLEEILKSETVKLEDLEIENPGLLSTNPFYFMKNWRRSTQRVLAFNAAKKAELELSILNEKAAELKKLLELAPDQSDALRKGLDLYEKSLNRLQNSLKEISDFPSAALLDRLLDRMIDRILLQIRFLDEVSVSSDNQIKERVRSLKAKNGDILAAIWQLDPSSFQKSFWQNFGYPNTNLAKEFRAVEVLDLFEERLPLAIVERRAIWQMREDLLLRIEVGLEDETWRAALPVLLQRLPGDFYRRVKILDEFREYATNVKLRNDLGVVRQLLLDLSAQSRVIGKTDAEQLIKEVSRLLSLAKESLPLSQKKNAIFLFARTEFNMDQAEESFRNTQYPAAFGQASVAAAALRNVFGQLAAKEETETAVRNLKLNFDQLLQKAQQSGLAEEKKEDFIKSLRDLEKKLTLISDLVNKNAKLGSWNLTMREAKLLFFKGEKELENLLEWHQKEKEAKRSTQSFLKRVLKTE